VIWVEHCDDAECVRVLRDDQPASSQIAAALAAFVIRTAQVHQ